MSTAKIALITGGNSGIGYGIAQRLLDHSVKNPGDQFHVVLACRNQTRAINAQNELLKEFPEGSVKIVLVDVTSVESVFKCCKEIKERFNRIDLFFCNAGALPCLYVDRWLIVKRMIFNPIALLSKPDVVVQPVGKTTTEGLGETFACNLFGHYVMIRELEDLLFKAKGRIIWTGSSVTAKRDLDMKDYQAVNGKAPYESSKRIVDLISIGLNSRLNKRNVYSFTTHPGVAATNIVRDHLGLGMGYMMEIALYMARTLGMRIQTITNWNGSYANYYVATQPIESLNTTFKYGSYCSPLGNVYVDTDVVEEYDEVETEVLISKLENILDNFRNMYKF